MKTTVSSDLPNFDAIRSRVLYQVDTDIAARGRKLRRRIAGGVGALAVLVIAGVAAPGLFGTGTPEVYRDGPVAAEAPMPSDQAMSAPEAMPGEAVDRMEGGAPNALETKAIPTASTPGKDREVITTGSASVTVKDPVTASSEFATWVTAHAGRIDGQNENRDADGGRSASLDIRLPAKQVGPAITKLRTYGEVNDVGIQRLDVTAQGRDLDARIKALRVSIDRLEAILAKSSSTDQVIEAETALSERQQELESMLSQRRSLTDQVSLSSVHVEFTQRDRAGDVEPDGFWGGLIKGWNALIGTVNAAVTALGALVPWLTVLLVLGGVWWIVRRARHKSPVD